MSTQSVEVESSAELLAATVRSLLARRLISQAQLAAHLHISAPAMSRRLRGVVPFSVGELTAVAEFLEVPVSSLLEQAS